MRGNKTDRTDTKALLEAGRNEEIHPVPVKTVEPHAMASLPRLRSTWLATRTSRLNTVRGLVREVGIFIPVGAQHVVPRVREWLAEDRRPAALRPTLATACDEVEALDAHRRAVDRQLTARARHMADVTVLQTVPGSGLLTATALGALVGDIQRFRSGRHFASVLGLTPQAASRAARRRLGAISTQGDTYLRLRLPHGARSFLWRSKSRGPPTARDAWARAPQHRRGHTIAAVAVANTLARIVWAVWTPQRPFTAVQPTKSATVNSPKKPICAICCQSIQAPPDLSITQLAVRNVPHGIAPRGRTLASGAKLLSHVLPGGA